MLGIQNSQLTVINFEQDLLMILLILTLYGLYRYMDSYSEKLNSDSSIIYNIDTCPVCLSEFAAPVRANCGHAFCLACLIKCFNTSNCHCPLCRNLIEDFEGIYNLDFYCNHERNSVKRMERRLRSLVSELNERKIIRRTVKIAIATFMVAWPLFRLLLFYIY